MSDSLKLPDPGTEGSWDVPFSYGKQTVGLTLTEDLVKQEISDQCSLKKPARKAILRATEKRLSKSLKNPFEALGKQAQDDTRWDLFIVMVNQVIADRHIQIREDSSIITEILESNQIRLGV